MEFHHRTVDWRRAAHQLRNRNKKKKKRGKKVDCSLDPPLFSLVGLTCAKKKKRKGREIGVNTGNSRSPTLSLLGTASTKKTTCLAVTQLLSSDPYQRWALWITLSGPQLNCEQGTLTMEQLFFFWCRRAAHANTVRGKSDPHSPPYSSYTIQFLCQTLSDIKRHGLLAFFSKKK